MDAEAESGVEFDGFYRAEFRGLVVLAAAVLGQRAGAEDVVQEAILDAYRRWDRVGGYEAPRAWARKVVVQRGIEVAKNRSNERHAHLRAAARVGAGATSAAATSIDPSLLVHLRALPPQQRAAVALHYLEDMSIKDIAALLGLAEGTVKAHLFKARASLSAAIGGDRPDPGQTDDHDDDHEEPVR